MTVARFKQPHTKATSLEMCSGHFKIYMIKVSVWDDEDLRQNKEYKTQDQDTEITKKNYTMVWTHFMLKQ